MIKCTYLQTMQSFDEYLKIAQNREELSKKYKYFADGVVEITLPRTSILNAWGDLHMWEEGTHHERIKDEADLIRKTKDSYFILGADLVGGIFWGGESGGEQMASLTLQHQTMKSLFEACKNKTLVGVSGEHDSKWAAKTGADPYADFTEKTGAPYVRGVGEVLVHVGKQTYKIVLQHKVRGHSFQNPVHGLNRQARHHLQGADIYIAFHTHNKGIIQVPMRMFGGANLLTYVQSGAYKARDSYGDRQGYISKYPTEMYGCSLRLHADKHKVDMEYDICEAHKQWG